MTGKQKIKLAMYESVIAHCENDPLIIAAVPVFETVLEELKEMLIRIHTKALEEQKNITGLAITKLSNRQHLIYTSLNIAGSICVYAATINDEELKQEFKLNYSDLNRLKDAVLTPACTAILGKAKALKKELIPFGINDAKISTAQTALAEYEDSVLAPRNAINERVAVSRSIKEIFKEADQLLKERIDRLAVQFKTIDPLFYERYKSTRSIKNTGVNAPQIALNHAS